VGKLHFEKCFIRDSNHISSGSCLHSGINEGFCLVMEKGNGNTAFGFELSNVAHPWVCPESRSSTHLPPVLRLNFLCCPNRKISGTARRLALTIQHTREDLTVEMPKRGEGFSREFQNRPVFLSTEKLSRLQIILDPMTGDVSRHIVDHLSLCPNYTADLAISTSQHPC